MEAHLIGCGLADAFEPDLGLRATGPQPHDGRVIVLGQIELATVHVKGDEFAMIVRTQPRLYLSGVDLGAAPRELFDCGALFRSTHALLLTFSVNKIRPRKPT